MVAFAGVDIMVGINVDPLSNSDAEGDGKCARDTPRGTQEEAGKGGLRRRLFLLEFNRSPAAPPPGPLTPQFKNHLVSFASALVAFSVDKDTSSFVDLGVVLG